MRAIILFAFLHSLGLQAEPERLEVIFLSRPKTALLSAPVLSWGPLMAQANYNCEPVGEGCFHPQLGFIEDPKKQFKPAPAKQAPTTKTINALEVDYIRCQKGNYFDLYCGKSEGPKKASGLEVWIDTSSSMRQVDFSDEKSYCQRRRLVAKLKEDCGNTLNVSIFNTAIKSLGGLDTLCLNYGMNDGERMVDWIKRNQAKRLVIVTDVDEYDGPLREYLDLVGAKIHGIGRDLLFAENLYERFSGALAKNCHKKQK